jgi:hypothetical protein
MSTANANPRYQGKPLLRLLECYVLWAIDQLPAADATRLKEMTPKLQSIYGVEGDWQQIIAAVMELPPSMPDTIRTLWAKNTEIARKNQATLTPQQFAEMFVDQNLVS